MDIHLYVTMRFVVLMVDNFTDLDTSIAFEITIKIVLHLSNN